MSKAIFIGTLFFTFFILANVSYAASIGVSPRKIEFNDEDKEKQITLYNPNAYKVSFMIKAENGSLIKFPAKGNIEGGASSTIMVQRKAEGQYLPELKDKLTIAFFDDNKDMLDIITSASVDIVLIKDTSDMINLNDYAEEEGMNAGEAKGWFNVSSILTMIAVLIIIGVFVWMMVIS